MTARARRGAQEPSVSLSNLTPFDGERLEPRRDYDAIEFLDLDLSGQDASDARFVECRIQRCAVDGLSFRRSRILGSVIDAIHGATVDFSDTTLRDSRISGGRLGAVNLPGASLTSVRFVGCKLGFLNMAGAQLEEVVFEGCEIDGLDVRGGKLRAVSFVDCSINELNVTEATLSNVDLSGARLSSLIGVDNLHGVTISHSQLLDLAPQFAAQLGIKVRPDESETGA